MVYYNAPNFNPNIVFESAHDDNVKHDNHLNDFPVYKINSRYSNPNLIQYDIELERRGRDNDIKSIPARELQLNVRFSKNRAHIKIHDPNHSRFQIPRKLI